MQKFTLHCHTNALGIFDGQNTAEEMISQAEKLGFEAIGISNHLCWHPNMQHSHPMFMNDEQKTVTMFKSILEETRTAAAKHKITVYNGLKNGDKVIMLRQQGGQLYFILDRAAVL